MALGTYTDIQAAIAKFLGRTDLTAAIPDYITLTEAAINRVIRHPRMMTRATAPIDTQYFVVPTDWLETVRFQVTADKTTPLELFGYDEIADFRAVSNETGIPYAYCHVGQMFEVYPTPAASYPADLLYYGAVPALSDTAQTNWLLVLAPDLYLYGALMAASPYLKNDERVAVWGTLYTRAVEELNTSGDRALSSGSGLRLRMR
jgi:hypothetical protein